MTSITRDELGGLVTNALERIAFVFAEHADDAAAGEFDHHSLITFQGKVGGGRLMLSASDGFLCELAANMLGMEAEDIDADVEGVQALMELANIVAGEVVLALGARDEHYSVGIPQQADAGIEGNVHTELDSSGERLRVAVAFEESAS